jgi:undecaprenyl-diphosphatase
MYVRARVIVYKRVLLQTELLTAKRLECYLRGRFRRSPQVRVLVFLLCLLAFLCFTLLKSRLVLVDGNVNSWAASIQTGSFTTTALMIDFVFDTPALMIITLLVTAFLFQKHYRKQSVFLAGAMLVNAILVEVTKMIVQTDRPFNALIAVSGFSYPSGHTSGSVVFCGLLTYYAWQHGRSLTVKTVSSVLYVIVTAIVGFDRLYLNVHWLSDVLGGWLLGVVLLAMSICTVQALEQYELEHPS